MNEADLLNAYEKLAQLAEEAEREKNSTATRNMAIGLGMVEEPADRQMDNYVLREGEWELGYSWRFYDTSKAFSPGLDRNILKIYLKKNAETVRSSYHEWMD